MGLVGFPSAVLAVVVEEPLNESLQVVRDHLGICFLKRFAQSNLLPATIDVIGFVTGFEEGIHFSISNRCWRKLRT